MVETVQVTRAFVRMGMGLVTAVVVLVGFSMPDTMWIFRFRRGLISVRGSS